MPHRTKHEIKAEVQELLFKITQVLEVIESPTIEMTDEGTGIVHHDRDKYLGSVKEICTAILQEEKTAEIIVSRCA